jgi:hypothetical protein
MKNLLGGFAGALALNLLHESYKRFDAKAPRIDLVGEEALSNAFESLGKKPPAGNILYATTLGADILSNTLYYSLIGLGNRKKIMRRALVLGVAAGVGALALTKPLGLSDAPLTRTNRTKLLTIALYFTGAIVAAYTIRALKKRSQ